MAEYVMKDLVKKAGLEGQFQIASAATSREELGNPVYPPARQKLAEHGISCDGHAALLMEYAGHPDQEVAAPWYTNDFDTAWRDVLAGCQGLFRELTGHLSNDILA